MMAIWKWLIDTTKFTPAQFIMLVVICGGYITYDQFLDTKHVLGQQTEEINQNSQDIVCIKKEVSDLKSIVQTQAEINRRLESLIVANQETNKAIMKTLLEDRRHDLP